MGMHKRELTWLLSSDANRLYEKQSVHIKSSLHQQGLVKHAFIVHYLKQSMPKILEVY